MRPRDKTYGVSTLRDVYLMPFLCEGNTIFPSLRLAAPLHILWLRPLRGACMVSAHPGTSSPARCQGPPALAGETCAGAPGCPPLGGAGRQACLFSARRNSRPLLPEDAASRRSTTSQASRRRRLLLTRSSPGTQSCFPSESKMNTARQQFSFLKRSLLIIVLKKLTFKTQFHKTKILDTFIT